ncbi:MAG: ZIP family metal transporter [Candidatus Marinimicrobia bacterium]|nr:ZIP family metal transporter [Candidatus Neomarinimicrobiota bacterium]
MLLSYIIAFSFLGSLGSVLISGLFLVFPDRIQNKLLPGLVSYATGAMLGAAFLRLIPHAIEESTGSQVSAMVLAGIVLFFVLEKLVLWRHCHETDCHVHNASGPLILIGDSFHNFVDGVVIAAAFFIDVRFGIATSISIISHEIPQEVGDFAILLSNNYSKKKAFSLNIISGLSAVVGGILAYYFMLEIQSAIPLIMAVSASSFIYIAVGDLMQGMAQNYTLRDTTFQLLLMLAGIGTILVLDVHP